MSERIVTTYLLGIAADYWHSPDFVSEYPAAASAGFSPVGRFGIGFLSVFMFGDNVEVQTQRSAGPNLTLKLRGVGRRGSLEVRPSALNTGTMVSVSITGDRVSDFERLARIVQAKAPMLDVSVRVLEGGTTSHIVPNWWQRASQEEFVGFLLNREWTASRPARESRGHNSARQYLTPEEAFRLRYVHLRETPILEKWPGSQPEVISDKMRLLALPRAGYVLLCSKGFAIGTIPIGGFVGMVDVGEVELNAARSAPIDFNHEIFRSHLLQVLRPNILNATNVLALARASQKLGEDRVGEH